MPWLGVTMILRDVTEPRSDSAGSPRPARPGSRARSGGRSGATSIVLDADLRLTYVAPAVARLLGRSPDALAAESWQAAVHLDDAPEVARVLLGVVAEPWRTERVVVRLRDAEGRWRPVEHVVTNHLGDPGVRGLVVDLRDLSDEVRTEDALRLSGALHRALVETAQEGILAIGADGSTSFANDRIAEILGLPVAGPVRRRHDGPAGAGEMGVRDRQGRGLLHRPGRSGPGPGAQAVPPHRTRRPTSLGSLVTVADVTEARRVESTLRRQALHDALTGLPNRYLFLDRLETAAARHVRSAGRGTALLFVDLDGFKSINDGHGHAAGDELLQEVAGRLAAAVRTTDTVGRLGGDEFAIICEDLDEQGAVVVAAKILGELRRPVRHRGDEHHIGVSIGVAVAPAHPFEELLEPADRAMYRCQAARRRPVRRGAIRGRPGAEGRRSGGVMARRLPSPRLARG